MGLGRISGIAILFAFLVAAVVEPQCGREPKLGDPVAGLNAEQRDEFDRGRVVFERVFTPETGLGPLFNANSCAECHEDPIVGGTGDEVEIHAAISSTLAALGSPDPALRSAAESGDSAPREDSSPPAASCDLLIDRGGPVFQTEVTQALHDALGIDEEPVPQEATQAQRTIPDVFGFGLLDAIADSTLLALEDPDDANGDGISGRANRFIDGRVGRFGRKAFVPNLAEFNDGAFQIEQGITTSGTPNEGTVGGQPMPPGVDPLPEPELSDEDVRLANQFVRFLAPPLPVTKGREVRLGEKIFADIGCTACHVPALRTGYSDVEALSNRMVRAYTDMLLHDMGPELADICFGLASPSEFRTEPLMGLSLSEVFLHDGRAVTIEAAIELHGGEGSAARDAFIALPEHKRKALLAFLRGL